MANSNEVDADYDEEIKKARRELRALIFKNNCAPLMLRLAWHDAATYDEQNGTGGPNGSIRTEQELNYAANKGLRKAVQLCEEVKAKLKRVSYADLYQLAGVVAVEITGGPTIDFQYGRTDSNDPQDDGLLPDPNQGAPHLRNTFCRMGLEDKDIVALSGAHTLGKAHKDGSDFEGQWTRDPLKFDKSYFVELLKGELLKLPTDKALLTDKKFREHVEAYAKDEDGFLRDYATSHKKFSELGCKLENRSKSKPLGFIRDLMPRAKRQSEDQLNQPNKEVPEGKEINEPRPSPNDDPKSPQVQTKRQPKKLIVIAFASVAILGYLLKRKIQAKKQ